MIQRSGIWTAVCLIFVTPLTSYLPRGIPVPFFRVNEILLLTMTGVVLLQSLVGGPDRLKRLFRMSWLDWLFGLLFLTGTIIPLVHYLLTTDSVVPGKVALYFDLVQFYLLYRILIVVVDDKRKLLACFLALCGAALVIASIGILEALNIPPIRQLIQAYYPTYNLERNIAIGYPRVVSLMGAPQSYAAFLAVNIFMCLSLMLHSAHEVPRRFTGLVLFVCALGFIPSGGYSAMIGVTFMFLLLLWFSRPLPNWIWVRGLATLAIGGFLFAPLILARYQFQFQNQENLIPTTMQERFDHWTLSRELLSPSVWILGYPGVLPSTLFSFENQYIHLLFRGGILHISAFVYFILRVVSESYKTFQQSDGLMKPVGLCTLIVITGLSLMGMTDSYFTNSGISEAIWTLVSLTALRKQLEPNS